jgi:NitT/TauT family transport system ATP-binding protein
MPNGLTIECAALRKAYLSRRSGTVEALAGVDLRVEPGEFVAVVGPSGCGKSTLLRLVAGLEAPSGGTVAVGGKPVATPRPDVALLFQRPTLLPWRTALGNVRLPAEARRLDGLDRRGTEARARGLLALVGLAGWEEAYPAELSGGMQARVALARALFADPALLLMDEPFGALDALTREDLARELLRIWSERRVTVLFVTHAIAEAVYLADRVVVMTPRPGRVAGEIAIDLPRPREALLDTSAFAERAAKVRALLADGR